MKPDSSLFWIQFLAATQSMFVEFLTLKKTSKKKFYKENSGLVLWILNVFFWARKKILELCVKIKSWLKYKDFLEIEI